MPKREQKNFHAIARGKIGPAMTQCWATANELVSGYPENLHKGFKTFDKAKAYLEGKGCFTFHFMEGPTDGPKPKSNQRAWYAVANGQNVGVYSDYRTGAELQVKKYSHACHKSFATSDAAEAFIQAQDQIAHLGSNRTDEDELVARLDIVTLDTQLSSG